MRTAGTFRIPRVEPLLVKRKRKQGDCLLAALVRKQRHDAVLESEALVDTAGQHVAVVPHAGDVSGIIAGDAAVFDAPGNRCGNGVLFDRVREARVVCAVRTYLSRGRQIVMVPSQSCV